MRKKELPLPDENRRKATRLDGTLSERVRLADTEGKENRGKRKDSEGNSPENPEEYQRGASEEDYGAGFKAHLYTDGYTYKVNKNTNGQINKNTGKSSPGKEKYIKKRKSAKEYALSLVGAHSYTEKAVREKLRSRKIYGEEEIGEAVEYLKGFKYIDDGRLAQNALEKLAARLYGKRRIKLYLASKGIPGEIIDGLDYSGIDFRENCLALAKKNTGKPEDKIIRTLTYAGFSSSEIAYAMKNLGR